MNGGPLRSSGWRIERLRFSIRFPQDAYGWALLGSNRVGVGQKTAEGRGIRDLRESTDSALESKASLDHRDDSRPRLFP